MLPLKTSLALSLIHICGAGDMLGPQQAGFIDTVGIDMYIEMLNSAIMEKKGIKKVEKPVMKKANIKVDAYIPGQFANEDYEKITLYQRIEKIEDVYKRQGTCYLLISYRMENL